MPRPPNRSTKRRILPINYVGRVIVLFKKIVAGALCVLLLVVPCAGLPQASVALYDPLSGKFLVEQNAQMRRGMASTTKIMTAWLACELYDPAHTVSVPASWCGVEGSSIYLQPEERVSVEELLYGLLLHSGNDAGVALASMMTGDLPDFVEAMNERAQEIGLLDTHFENPHGLDAETHYSTACDMARLAAAALENELFATIVARKSIRIGSRSFVNHNRLLSMVDGADGVKTGFTKRCGRCLVSSVTRNGRRLIAVTLGAPDDWNDHAALYRMGFARFTQKTILTSGKISSVTVAGEECHDVELYVQEGFDFFTADSDNIEVRLNGPQLVYAPVKAGEQYGTACVRIGGKTLFETPVYYCDGVAAPEKPPTLLEKLFGKTR